VLDDGQDDINIRVLLVLPEVGEVQRHCWKWCSVQRSTWINFQI
jgi:hypothetical protein